MTEEEIVKLLAESYVQGFRDAADVLQNCAPSHEVIVSRYRAKKESV